MPANRLDDIFEPFEQVKGGYNRWQEGSGLGLAISLWVCEVLGLALTVKSELGVGSTFCIVFPPDEGTGPGPTHS